MAAKKTAMVFMTDSPIKTKVSKMNNMTSFKLWTLEQQESYLRKNKGSTDKLRKYIFLRFEKSLIYFFGDDAKDIIEELR